MGATSNATLGRSPSRTPGRAALAALVALVMALSSPPAAAAGDPPARADSQLWSELDVDAKVLPATTLTATALVREGSGLPDPTIWGAGLLVDHTFFEGLSAGVGDLFLTARSSIDGARVNVQAPLAAVTGIWHFGSTVVSDRNRVERLIGAPADPWRYRNRLMVDTPLANAAPLAAVFASDEVFFDKSREEWTRNRAQFGVRFTPVGPATLELYLMRQDDSYARPAALNIVGVVLRLDVN